jgi:hypothetical protein
MPMENTRKITTGFKTLEANFFLLGGGGWQETFNRLKGSRPNKG